MEHNSSYPAPPSGDENNRPVANPYLAGKPKQNEVNDASETATARDSGRIMEIEESNHTPQQQQSQDQQETIQLLQMLQRDYEELKKTSVKGCLRSKQVPCSEVRSVLEEKQQFTLPALQQAYETVIGHHDFLGSFQNTTRTRSSLGCMTRIGTAVRLIQVLVSWKEHLDETSLMIGGLLQAICSTMGEAMKQYKEESQSSEEEKDENDEHIDLYSGPISESFHAPQVACFAFAFLLRIKSLFVEHRIELLSGLWKFLDILAQGLAPQLPQELLGDSIQTLGGYLKDFLQPALGLVTLQLTPGQYLPLSAMKQKTKLCSFFFARLASLLKLSRVQSAELDQTIVENVMNVLVHFRGLATAAAASVTAGYGEVTANLDPFQKIAGKAEKCLLELLLLHRKEETTSKEFFLPNNSHLQLLLQLEGDRQEVDTNTDKQQQTLAKTAFEVGILQILVQVLKVTIHSRTAADEISIPPIWNNEANVDTLLAVSEHLIFVCVPGCNDLLIASFLHNDRDMSGTMLQLFHEALHLLSSFLYQCETLAPCMTSNADRGVITLHRLLVRWLLPTCESADAINSKESPNYHPLSRQIVLALVQMHATHLYRCFGETRDTFDSDMPLLELLVKIFFDARTTVSHRSTIGSLFRNIFTTQSQPLLKQLQYLLCAEYKGKRPRLSTTGKRKRKKKDKERAHDRHKLGWNSFSLEDVQVIGSILSLLPVSLLPDLTNDVESFSLKVASSSGNSRRSSTRLSMGSVKTASICLSLLEAMVREDPSQVALNNITGEQNLFVFLRELITWFLGYWDAEFANGRRKRAEQDRIEMLAILGTAILRLVVFSCERAGANSENTARVDRMAHDQMQKVYQFVNACTDENRVLWLCDSSSLAQPSNRPIMANLVLEASRCLSVIGHAIPLEKPESALQGIFGLFQRLLKTDVCWSLSTYTISSLHEFSTTLPRAYKSQLPTCIPKRQCKGLLALLQCRIQGSVYRYELHKRKKTATVVSDKVFDSMQDLHAHCTSKLGTLICRGPRITRSTKPCSDSLTIFAGSYFLTMPTQEGRKAVVIFPPGEASLKDINYMLGTGEVEGDDDAGETDQGVNPRIQQLHRVLVEQDGSCKFVLI